MRSLAWLLLVLGVVHAVPASEPVSGPMRVVATWARALPPVSRNGAAYLTVTNESSEGDALVGVSTSKAARAELHRHSMEGGLMKMRPVDAVEIPPHATVTFEPGGLHVMLVELASPLVAGERFPLRLEFRNAPAVEVEVEVIGTGEPVPAAGDHGHGEHGGGM